MSAAHWIYTIPLRLRSLFRRSRVEQDLEDEFQYHLEQQTAELMNSGMPAAEARNAALRAFGAIEQQKEICRDSRRVNAIHDLLQDVRYGTRMMLHAPGFAVVAVLTLALGIGASTAMFSLLNTVVLAPLPYSDPDRIVALMHFSPSWAPGQKHRATSIPEYMTYREQTTVFLDLAAYNNGTFAVNLIGREFPEQLRALKVSEEYFRVFSTPLVLGRGFRSDEDRPGGPLVAAISEGVWRRHFDGDPSVIGRGISIGGEIRTVVGIVGSAFLPNKPADIWMPLQANGAKYSNEHLVWVDARLRPGVTVETANAQLKVAKAQFDERYPPRASSVRNFQESFLAVPLQEAVAGDVRHPLFLLFGAVILLLLIVCANVGNLLLVRGTARNREMALRTALGAARFRLVCQLLTEGLILSAAGAVLGVPLGLLALRVLLTFYGGDIPRVAANGTNISIDGAMLTFSVVTCVVTTALFGVIPALRTSRVSTVPSIHDGGPGAGISRQKKNARSVLVAAEIALTVVLLAGAALLIQTFNVLRRTSPGFDHRNILTLEMALSDPRYRTSSAVAQLVSEAERRIHTLPGVVAVAATYTLPVENSAGMPFVIESRPNDRYLSNTAYVSREYFDVFRIPVLEGRVFGTGDHANGPSVVLINEALSNGIPGRYSWRSGISWRNGNPLDDRITIGKEMGPPSEDVIRQVIGKVGQVRDTGIASGPQPLIYVPLAQLADGWSVTIQRLHPIVWAVRTEKDPAALSRNIERELRAASGGLPVAHIRTMDDVVAESTSRNRFQAAVLSSFAGAALLLASIGVYGVLAWTVRQKTREIGIRVALGASPGDLQRALLFQSCRIGVTGLALGLAGTVAMRPLIAGLLYGVDPSDPRLLLVVSITISAAVLLATFIPARWATRVDPMVALRWE